MKNDAFIDKCRQLTSSIEVDYKKNLDAIKSKISTGNEDREEGNDIMLKSKRIRKPAVAAAILAAILSISTIVYAAAPIIWRNIDATVSDGEQYVESLIAKISEDGTLRTVGGYFTEDSGRAVIDTADGERIVFNDGLQPHDLQEALTVLQLDYLAFPAYMPDGFAITAFAYPASHNDNLHDAAMNHMSIMYSNGHDVIALMISPEEGFALSASEERALEKITVNGVSAFLGEGQLVLHDGHILYRFSSSPDVDNGILVRMAESISLSLHK